MFYLKQANGSLLIGFSIFHYGHNVWVSLCNLSHPVAYLEQSTVAHYNVSTSVCAFRHACDGAFLTSGIGLYLK